MHELPVIKSVFDVCMKHATANHAKKILAVSLEVGELSDLEDEWMQRYFDFIGKDTVAAGAVLKIKRIPLVMECQSCQFQFRVNLAESKDGIKCPECGKKMLRYVSGRGYCIENMEIV